MKRFGLVFPSIMLILAMVLNPLSLADSSGTLRSPGDFSVRIEDNYALITFDGAEHGQYTKIERSTDSGEFIAIAAVGPGVTSFKDYGIANGHIYKYRACRYSGEDPSPYTREIEVISLYPVHLYITGVYSDQVNLAWSYPQLLIPRTITIETVIERKAEGKTGWTEIYRAPYHQTEFRDYGLDPDTIYYYRVRTLYPDGQYSKYIPTSSGVYKRTTIPLVTPLTGFAASDNRIRLDWDREAIKDHVAYLQRQDSFGNFHTIFTSSTADHYVDASAVIMPGEEYTYRLYLSSESGSVSGYSESVTIKAETIPAPPQLSASPGAYGRINLIWEYPYDVESGFEIWRKEQGKIWEKVGEAGRNTDTWTDYSAHTDTAYRYRVRAVRGKNVYSDFAVSELVNNADPSIPGKLFFVPAGKYILIGTDEPAPEWVKHTLELRTGINEEWRDYTLSQREGSLLVYFFPAEGKEYEFRIRCENQGNISYGPVYRLPASVPEAPAGLRVAYMGSNRVLLSWSDTSKSEDGYRIYRIEGQKRTLLGTTQANAVSFADTKAVPGSKVRYELRAYNARGESAGVYIDVSVPQKAAFRDLGGYPWCADSVNALAASGAIALSADGLFRPGASITRAEFVTILLKAFNIIPESEFLFPVRDVPRNSWYYPYMMTAVKMGIVIPDQNRNAGPLSPVTRADMAVYMNRLLASMNRTLDSISVSYLDRFTDGYKVSEDLKGIISSLAGDGILPPQGGLTLDLDKPATRAEAAVVLHRFTGRYNRTGR